MSYCHRPTQDRSKSFSNTDSSKNAVRFIISWPLHLLNFYPETIRSDERFQALSAFNSIHGVGPTTARHLYSVGLRTLEDMDRYYDVPIDSDGRLKVEEEVVFTPNGRRVPPQKGIPGISIRTSLALRADFEQTMLPSEVEEMHAVVMSELGKIQKGCVSTIVGG